MIKKFKSIKNFGVFKNFEWDSKLVDKEGKGINFSPVNILYGRNYSGKTTLSRMLRAIELNKLPEKFDNPQFEIITKNGDTINETNIDSCHLSVRVFNEDFVKDKLRFFSNPEEGIEPFAIFGENAILESEIKEVESKLGSQLEGQESGLYLDKVRLAKECKDKDSSLKAARSKLEDQLADKANDKETGIRNNSGKFGDQTYTKKKLENEIESVCKPNFVCLSAQEVAEQESVAKEDTKVKVTEQFNLGLDWNALCVRIEQVVTLEIGNSNKIADLVRDIALHQWVDSGRELHKEKKNCAFCGGILSKERWQELNEHFDEESKKFTNTVDALIAETTKLISDLPKRFQPKTDLFYTKFQKDIKELHDEFNKLAQNCTEQLKLLLAQLQERKKNLFSPQKYREVYFDTTSLQKIFLDYEELVKKTNEHSNSLSKEQENAKKMLRLTEVYNFKNTIQYEDKKEELQNLETAKGEIQSKLDQLNNDVNNLEGQRLEKKRQQNDEGKGAKLVNQYLNDYFGHKTISLNAVESTDPESQGKKVKFEVVRNGKIAHNLSEGECSLLAFCYFLAKLNETETKDSKPIKTQR